MFDSRVIAVAVAGTALALGACGGGDEATPAGPGPFADEIIACLESRGAEAELLDEGFGIEVVAGQTAGGDIVFFFHTPNRKLAARAIGMMKKAKRARAPGGVMLMSTVNAGSTVVGAIGHEGVNGGMPSDRSEALAKACAIGPQI